MTGEMLTSHRELHSRTTDGMVIRLLWCAEEDRVFVSVDDQKTGQAFSVDVPKGERPMHVFTHPFAYANQTR
jgi:hypothetical protein